MTPDELRNKADQIEELVERKESIKSHIDQCERYGSGGPVVTLFMTQGTCKSSVEVDVPMAVGVKYFTLELEKIKSELSGLFE